MRDRSIAVSVVLALSVACGGSDAVQGPPDDGAAPTPLDFSQIAGTWSGWGKDGLGSDMWLITEVEASVFRDGQLGASTVGVTLGNVECTHDSFALSANPPRP